MTEAELTAEVEKLCGELGLLFHHCPDGRGCHGQRGFPDLIIVGVRGLALLELKSADGELSPDQALWTYTLYKAGIGYWLIKPEHLEAGMLRAILEALA